MISSLLSWLNRFGFIVDLFYNTDLQQFTSLLYKHVQLSVLSQVLDSSVLFQLIRYTSLTYLCLSYLCMELMIILITKTIKIVIIPTMLHHSSK